MHLYPALLLGSFCLSMASAKIVPGHAAAEVYARSAEPEHIDGSTIYPRSWLESRDPMGKTHLGDDGVLRSLTIRMPEKRSPDDHLIEARWTVVDAKPLTPREIKWWNDEYAQGDVFKKRHLEEEYHQVDGRDIHPRDLLDPHPKFMPRSPGTMADMWSILARSAYEDTKVLSQRQACVGKPCVTRGECQKRGCSECHLTDKEHTDRCSNPIPGWTPPTAGTVAAPGSPA